MYIHTHIITFIYWGKWLRFSWLGHMLQNETTSRSITTEMCPCWILAEYKNKKKQRRKKRTGFHVHCRRRLYFLSPIWEEIPGFHYSTSVYDVGNYRSYDFVSELRNREKKKRNVGDWFLLYRRLVFLGKRNPNYYLVCVGSLTTIMATSS